MKKLYFTLICVLFVNFSCNTIPPNEYHKLLSEEIITVFKQIENLNTTINQGAINNIELKKTITITEKAYSNIKNIGHSNKYSFIYKMTLMNLSGINDLLIGKYENLFKLLEITDESRTPSDIDDIIFYKSEINEFLEYYKNQMEQDFSEFETRYKISDNLDIKYTSLL